MTLHIAPMAVETDMPPTHWLLDPHCKELPGMLHYHSLDVFVQLDSMYSAFSWRKQHTWITTCKVQYVWQIVQHIPVHEAQDVLKNMGHTWTAIVTQHQDNSCEQVRTLSWWWHKYLFQSSAVHRMLLSGTLNASIGGTSHVFCTQMLEFKHTKLSPFVLIDQFCMLLPEYILLLISL
jgi:hypothetical protein